MMGLYLHSKIYLYGVVSIKHRENIILVTTETSAPKYPRVN
jgi:hypothetical protein